MSGALMARTANGPPHRVPARTARAEDGCRGWRGVKRRAREADWVGRIPVTVQARRGGGGGTGATDAGWANARRSVFARTARRGRARCRSE